MSFLNLTLPQVMDKLRNDTTRIYLGDRLNCAEKVEWARNGTGFGLVPKTGSDKSKKHEYALFTAVVQISTSNCYLMPDGAWTGLPPRDYPLEKVKLTCNGEKPDDLHDDDKCFKNLVANIQDMERLAKVSTDNIRSIIRTDNDEITGVKFRHVLFEVSLS